MDFYRSGVVGCDEWESNVITLSSYWEIATGRSCISGRILIGVSRAGTVLMKRLVRKESWKQRKWREGPNVLMGTQATFWWKPFVTKASLSALCASVGDDLRGEFWFGFGFREKESRSLGEG